MARSVATPGNVGAALASPARWLGHALSLAAGLPLVEALSLAAGHPFADAQAATLAVPTDFRTIQAAIDAANSNDVVLVEPGSYRENLSLKSGVDVVGRETARTMLAPDDDMQPTVTIANVAGARFSNFTLLDASVGVSVAASTGIDVANVVFDGASDRAFVAAALSAVSLAHDVFFQNNSAVVRGDAGVEVVNNIFVGNTTTITTTLALVDPLENVRANCFFANRDLAGAGAGAGAVVGDPLFVDASAPDFHLLEGSPCIDIGPDLDIVDETVADAGVYGGQFSDLAPFPVAQPQLAATGAVPPGISISWAPNLDYRVTNSVNPGSYRVYYKMGGAPTDNVPSAYDGRDAGGGTLPSPVEAGAATSFTLEGLTAESQPPVAPVLREATGRDQAVGLTWDAVEGATGYRVYFGTNAVTENRVEAGNVTSFAVTGLANGTPYRFAVSAVVQPSYTIAVTALDYTPDRHESALSMPATLAIGEPAEGPLSQELMATPEHIIPYPDLRDESGCFIATAAFGAEWKPEVLALRDFRDRYLLTNTPGRWLVGRYYALSPPAARYLDAHAALKPLVRAALWPLVIVALIALDGSRPALAVALLLGVAAVVLRRRVRRLARETGGV
ncbi:MAG TPA: CFI-box-CTERM domain-containing protein [Gammaproteobacteria bacterium]|nr:CFI-box-CTERM domain-containing protein [Gammaproteobacteria bacterium]